jgi:SAM-dependent methyltransferase
MVEASLTPSASLRIGPRSRQRYLSPSESTAYPLEYAYSLLGDIRGRDVLDLGCGNGIHTALLALRGARVQALDVSPDLVGLAEERLRSNAIEGDVRFIIGSAHAIGVPDESVDVVFGIAILHHLDLAQAAAETFRVLRPGGRAIFQEPIRNSRIIRAIRPLIPYRAPDISPYERPLTNAEVEHFGRRFRSGRSRSFRLPHIPIVQAVPPLRRYVDAAYRVDQALLRQPWMTRFASVRVFELIKE